MILTPDILALVPDAASPAIAFNMPAISELLKPVVFNEKCKSVDIVPICVATYALIDCCVASAVAELDEKSSSSNTS